VIRLAASLAAGTLLVASPLKATLTAPSHSPRINKHWNYVLRASENGKPVKARLTAQIVDPIGGVHYVERGPTTQKLRSWPFTGVYRDYIIWPASSRGIPLTLRLTVVAGSARKVIEYHVVPRA
jgi:hypothetical protein